jgi:hypothetical protein
MGLESMHYVKNKDLQCSFLPNRGLRTKRIWHGNAHGSFSPLSPLPRAPHYGLSIFQECHAVDRVCVRRAGCDHAGSLPDCSRAFYYRTVNIERKFREAQRKAKAEAKRVRRAARRLQKAGHRQDR